MGIVERRERHKEDLRKDILFAAKTLFMEKGFDKTSMRNIAEMIEYSPATIYLYYKDKNEILHELRRDGFRELIEHFKVLQAIDNPFEKLKAMGRSYIQFALQKPDSYKLIFTMEEPLEHMLTCGDDNWVEGDQAFDVLIKTVSECQQLGYFKGFEASAMSLVIWSSMHGLCTLRTSGHLGHVSVARTAMPDLDQLMTFTFEAFVSMLEKLKA